MYRGYAIFEEKKIKDYKTDAFFYNMLNFQQTRTLENKSKDSI